MPSTLPPELDFAESCTTMQPPPTPPRKPDLSTGLDGPLLLSPPTANIAPCSPAEIAGVTDRASLISRTKALLRSGGDTSPPETSPPRDVRTPLSASERLLNSQDDRYNPNQTPTSTLTSPYTFQTGTFASSPHPPPALTHNRRLSLHTTLTNFPPSPSPLTPTRRLSLSTSPTYPSPLTPHHLTTHIPPSPRPSRRLSLPPLPLTGSYETSLLHGRLSTPSSPPIPFTLTLGCLGHLPCPPSLRCPPHLTVQFPAFFHSLPHDPTPSPYIGFIPLTRYRIPPAGQLQLIIKNAEKSAVKVFLLPYDVREIKPGQKTMVRQRLVEGGRLRGAVQVGICCTGRGRVWVYRALRVVFANRGEGDGERTEECVWARPKYSRMGREEREGVGMGGKRKKEGPKEERNEIGENESGWAGLKSAVERAELGEGSWGKREIEMAPPGQGLLARKLKEVALLEDGKPSV